MKDIEALLIELLQDKKKRLFLIGGAALAVLLVVLILVTILGGSGRKYNKYYSEAESAYRAGDYAVAEEKLRRAMELKNTEKAYLLLAEVYCAEGETDRAIQILYLGYSHLGSAKIEKRLDELKSGQGMPSVTAPPQESLTIGGKSMDSGITSLVLTGTRLKDADLEAISSLSRMESLGISDCGIRGLDFLSGLTGLTFLQISDNLVRDLTPIAGMKNLKTLYIDNNPITDLTPLYSLSALRTLSMKGIEVSYTQLDELREALPNCSVYADEPEDNVRELKLGGRTFRSDVTELNLGGLGITDLSVLRSCTSLEKLDLRDNKITDISPLVELPNLKWLRLWNNKIEDINPLLSLSGIEFLDLDGNNVSDISVLEYLPNLKALWLNKNPLNSLEPLRSMTGLEKLGLANTGLTDEDLTLLAGLKSLTELNIKGNETLSAGAFDKLQSALPKCDISHDKLLYSVIFGDHAYFSDAVQIVARSQEISDLSGLEDFADLQRLDLAGNQIGDLSALSKLANLTELNLSGNRVSDLAPLAGLKALRKLDLRGNSISNLTPLAGCSALTELTIGSNSVRDLTPLAYLTELTTLNAADNSITDLSALYTLSALRTLDVRGNPLKADDILALQTALPDCAVLHDLELPSQAPEQTPTPAQPSITVTSPTVPTPPATATDLR